MSKFYTVPWRWCPKKFFANIEYICKELFWYGPRNVIRWAPVIWLDVNYDWSSLADIMQYKLSMMADAFEKYGHHVGSEKDSRNMRICALLLKRLSEDEYYDNASKAFGYGNKAWAKEVGAVQKQDQELLFRIMSKHFTHWWD